MAAVGGGQVAITQGAGMITLWSLALSELVPETERGRERDAPPEEHTPYPSAGLASISPASRPRLHSQTHSDRTDPPRYLRHSGGRAVTLAQVRRATAGTPALFARGRLWDPPCYYSLSDKDVPPQGRGRREMAGTPSLFLTLRGGIGHALKAEEMGVDCSARWRTLQSRSAVGAERCPGEGQSLRESVMVRSLVQR
ncbi:hypothetical protein SKAU_G00108460 [Synaphobranchus kaupii]|uniref:Uncharacterized protein n=1 Tax=Synaphobranchus kaupii TaxID=118154 RepID=A0A9Q1J859_SYNKA|nr:hypothetical protein SKAU_G00108460 [Synaphobranchus kaupii]